MQYRGFLYTSSIIQIGSIPLGGSYPIRIQSMTNTDTLDTNASVEQCIRIIEAGADYVRLTAQGVGEAENLAAIKREIRKAGFDTPLIADIHFNPAAAETAARIVEKVRINPGNYADKRATFIKVDFTEKEYDEELERIHARLLPLINICREHKTVVRIGINHGSLSDRIMTRYGNTPLGMVSSAMEFIHIFRSENFNDLVLSMKSSDTAIMIEANRMLISALQKENLSYPVHMGVTEAGEGEDGRVRSAAGIGALLSEGIGDTIRVSLSEDPEKEIPVAQKLVKFFPRGIANSREEYPGRIGLQFSKPPHLARIKGPLVVADLSVETFTDLTFYKKAGFKIDGESNGVIRTDGSADLIISSSIPANLPGSVNLVVPYKEWTLQREKANVYPLLSGRTVSESIHSHMNVILADKDLSIQSLRSADPVNSLLLYRFSPDEDRYSFDKFLSSLNKNSLSFNVILNPVFREKDHEELLIKAASLAGRYLTDRLVAGICISNEKEKYPELLAVLSFSILQCTGTRITRTQYLSCPTCGRTKFNLQKAVKKVKIATSHLKGLKIAVMGCIVNGPGEMAGADYGYVGAAAGKVHIYKGTEPVLKNVSEEDAIAELLKIIEKDQ